MKSKVSKRIPELEIIKNISGFIPTFGADYWYKDIKTGDIILVYEKNSNKTS